MPREVYLKGKAITLDPKRIIGSGGEADIFNIGGGYALKIFKPPTHPDYQGLPLEQQGAKERIATHQRKLRDFPKNLPSKVVTPIDLATDSSSRNILGYEMKLISNSEVLMRYSERSFRAAIPNQDVNTIFRGLHTTVDATHQAGVVIGDFNDLNVLVSNTEAYIIDADSCQWGPYLCKVYTNKFVDPILCSPTGMIKHHNENSDWYAFSVMLFQSLLFVDPYGGVYRPKNPKDKIPPSARQLKRITVFNPEVIYPKPAVPYWVLPDDLLNHFHRLFEQDVRGVFPVGILENMRWTQCNTCGLVHARDKCPQCNQAAPGTITKREVVKVDGKKIIFDRLFQTSGRILFATYQNGIKYLYQNDGETCFRREDGSIAVDNITDNPKMRFRINGKNTLVAMGHKMFLLSPNQTPESVMVDNFGSLPMFDANQNHRYWLTNGRLWRNGLLGNELVGESLENQTLFWVGDKFGFGFYQSGEMSMHFTFDSNRSGINDSVKLPRIVGQLIDSSCVFSDNLCWFFTSVQYNGKRVNQCHVIKADGTVVGSASGTINDGSWLGNIRGNVAIGNFLLSATDDGIVKVQPNDTGQIEITQEFSDTEPYVSSADHLFLGNDGLTIVKPKEVWNIRII